MRIAVFRKGRRTGIEVIIVLSKGFPNRQVGVAVEQDVALLKGRQAVGVIMVAVSCIDDEASLSQDGIRRHDGKFQDHLIDFAVAVAADAEDGILLSLSMAKTSFGL